MKLLGTIPIIVFFIPLAVMAIFEMANEIEELRQIDIFEM